MTEAARRPDRQENKDDSNPDIRPKAEPVSEQDKKPREIDGRGGLDPSRYGDWEKNGRCIDF